jgi:hypothetical protein
MLAGLYSGYFITKQTDQNSSDLAPLNGSVAQIENLRCELPELL